MTAPFEVDTIIDRLLEVRGSKPGRSVPLSEAEIRELCYRSREIFISQPILLELEAPIKICGKSLFFLSVYSTHPVPSQTFLRFSSLTTNI